MSTLTSGLRCQTVGDTTELWIYGVIDADGVAEPGDVTPGDVKDAIRSAKGSRTLDVHIHSPGGDPFSGFAIYTLLRQSGKRIIVDVDGVAASAASIVAMSGDIIRISDQGRMMVHRVYSPTGGNSDALRKKADLADNLTEQLIDLYSRRTKQPRAEIARMVDAETWLDAKQALRLGFADEISSTQGRMAASIAAGDLERLRLQEHSPGHQTARAAPRRRTASPSRRGGARE